MMKWIVVILISTFQFVHAQNVIDAKGRKQGPWSKTYPKSTIPQFKGQFKDDIPTGTFTFYYENGKVKAVIKHGPNALRSEAFFYHENAKLMSHGIYRSQKKDSVWVHLNEDGFVTYTEEFKNDLLNGKRTIYFLPEREGEKQRVSAIELYQNGLLQGEYVEYLISGTVSLKGKYDKGKKIGVWESFHQNGQKMSMERYKNGVPHGWCHAYDMKGSPTSSSYFFEGKRLQGKQLKAKLQELEEKGIDPNN
jgi:antitoxin component YwqK of YwqJK toxin-antitoxin module